MLTRLRSLQFTEAYCRELSETLQLAKKPPCRVKATAAHQLVWSHFLTQSCMPSACSRQRGTVSAELLSWDCTGMPAGLFTTQKSSSRWRTVAGQSVVEAAGYRFGRGCTLIHCPCTAHCCLLRWPSSVGNLAVMVRLKQGKAVVQQSATQIEMC